MSILTRAAVYTVRIAAVTAATPVLAGAAAASATAKLVGWELRQQAPRANAIAERWIASARRECLDRMLIVGERHLRLVDEYVDHYNTHRPHRGLHQNPPAGRLCPPAAVTSTRVLRRDRLGGPIHEYAQVA